MTTAAHEYGHYVNYVMWGSSSTAFNAMYNNKETSESWAMFYSYATRHYAYKKGIATGGLDGPDLRDKVRDNFDFSTFTNPKFMTSNYSYDNTNYPRWACYLWNLYDGNANYNYYPNSNFTDNDDIAMPARVFSVYKNLGTKTMANFYTSFKSGLSSSEISSVDAIYNNVMNDNTSYRMRSANFISPSLSTNANSTNNLTLSCTYRPFDFPDSNAPNTRNSPTNFPVYRQRFLNAPWFSVGNFTYNGSNLSQSGTFTVSNPTLYNYKLCTNNGNESNYPHIFTHSSSNTNAPTLSFSITAPYSINVNQGYSTEFYLSGISGEVSDLLGNYYYEWYVSTEFAWVPLSKYYSSSGKPYIFLGTYNNYKSPYGYGYVEFKCVGTNNITGQQNTTYKSIICNGCLFAGRSPSAPQDSIDMGNMPVFFPEELSDVNEGVDLFPNPVTDYLQVNIDGHSNYSFIKIFTAQGLEVKTVSPVNATNMINVSDLPAGKYILSLTGANKQKSFHFTRL